MLKNQIKNRRILVLFKGKYKQVAKELKNLEIKLMELEPEIRTQQDSVKIDFAKLELHYLIDYAERGEGDFFKRHVQYFTNYFAEVIKECSRQTRMRLLELQEQFIVTYKKVQ